MNFLNNLFSLESSPQNNRNYAMEGVRGVAILLVFLCHYADIVSPQFKLPLGAQHIARGVSELGRSGVALFFVLSGYLIYRTVVRPSFSLRHFWARRLQRIYPAFLVVFSLYLAMWLIHAGSDKSGEQLGVRIPHDSVAAWGYLLENVFFLPGIFPIQPLMNVAWSLSYEWFFYLVIPIAAVGLGKISQRSHRLSLLAGLSAIYLSISYCQPSIPWPAGMNAIHFVAAHNGLVMFLGGVMVYEITQRPNRVGMLDEAALAVLLVSLAVPLLAGTWQVHQSDAPIEGCLFVAYSLLLYFSIQGGGLIARVMSLKPLRALGNISYSFYLIHGLPIHLSASFAGRFGHSLKGHPGASVLASLIFLPLCLLFTTAVSLALFWAVERPLSLRSETKTVHKASAPLHGPALPTYAEQHS